MPSTSAIAKKSTSGTKQNAGTMDTTPTRISSRVRKEKFNVKELFSQRETSNDNENLKKNQKKKPPEPSKSSVTPKNVVASKSLGSKPPTVPKVVPVKSQMTTKLSASKTPSDELTSAPGPSKAIEISLLHKTSEVVKPPVQKGKPAPQSVEEKNMTDCIFNENNIDSVIENPSALGLDIVVTKLSDSEGKDSGENEKTRTNIVTISKVTGGDAMTKPVKIVPMKLDKGEERHKSKDKEVHPDVIPKGLCITPKTRVVENVSKKVTHSHGPSDLDRKLEKELEDLLNDATVSLKSTEDKRIGKSQPVMRKETGKRKRNIEVVNGRNSDVEDITKRNKVEAELSRYFIISQSLVEHNDSLDSESDNEETVLSHFLPSRTLRKGETSIYDLASEVSLDMPAWNLHILQDTGSFILAHVARGPNGLPVMNKIIELDQWFTAKVYVNQIYQRQYSGTYDSYEAIRELVTSVNHL